MTDSISKHEVIGARVVDCPGCATCKHPVLLKLKDGAELDADDAIALLKAGAELFMIPPEGAPAHEAHVATGLPLHLQWRQCGHCQKEIVFA